MRVILENVNKQHVGLLKQMADILNFRFKGLNVFLPEAFLSDTVISPSEEKEMTQFLMQAS